MSDEKRIMLSVKIPAALKYRLDRATLEEGTTLQKKVTKILDEALPHYEEVS